MFRRLLTTRVASAAAPMVAAGPLTESVRFKASARKRASKTAKATKGGRRRGGSSSGGVTKSGGDSSATKVSTSAVLQPLQSSSAPAKTAAAVASDSSSSSRLSLKPSPPRAPHITTDARGGSFVISPALAERLRQRPRGPFPGTTASTTAAAADDDDDADARGMGRRRSVSLPTPGVFWPRLRDCLIRCILASPRPPSVEEVVRSLSYGSKNSNNMNRKRHHQRHQQQSNGGLDAETKCMARWVDYSLALRQCASLLTNDNNSSTVDGPSGTDPTSYQVLHELLEEINQRTLNSGGGGGHRNGDEGAAAAAARALPRLLDVPAIVGDMSAPQPHGLAGVYAALYESSVVPLLLHNGRNHDSNTTTTTNSANGEKEEDGREMSFMMRLGDVGDVVCWLSAAVLYADPALRVSVSQVPLPMMASSPWMKASTPTAAEESDDSASTVPIASASACSFLTAPSLLLSALDPMRLPSFRQSKAATTANAASSFPRRGNATPAAFFHGGGGDGTERRWCVAASLACAVDSARVLSGVPLVPTAATSSHGGNTSSSSSNGRLMGGSSSSQGDGSLCGSLVNRWASRAPVKIAGTESIVDTLCEFLGATLPSGATSSISAVTTTTTATATGAESVVAGGGASVFQFSAATPATSAALLRGPGGYSRPTSGGGGGGSAETSRQLTGWRESSVGSPVLAAFVSSDDSYTRGGGTGGLLSASDSDNNSASGGDRSSQRSGRRPSAAPTSTPSGKATCSFDAALRPLTAAPGILTPAALLAVNRGTLMPALHASALAVAPASLSRLSTLLRWNTSQRGSGDYHGSLLYCLLAYAANPLVCGAQRLEEGHVAILSPTGSSSSSNGGGGVTAGGTRQRLLAAYNPRCDDDDGGAAAYAAAEAEVMAILSQDDCNKGSDGATNTEEATVGRSGSRIPSLGLRRSLRRALAAETLSISPEHSSALLTYRHRRNSNSHGNSSGSGSTAEGLLDALVACPDTAARLLLVLLPDPNRNSEAVGTDNKHQHRANSSSPRRKGNYSLIRVVETDRLLPQEALRELLRETTAGRVEADSTTISTAVVIPTIEAELSERLVVFSLSRKFFLARVYSLFLRWQHECGSSNNTNSEANRTHTSSRGKSNGPDLTVAELADLLLWSAEHGPAIASELLVAYLRCFPGLVIVRCPVTAAATGTTGAAAAAAVAAIPYAEWEIVFTV